jgi:hypothetical protein
MLSIKAIWKSGASPICGEGSSGVGVWSSAGGCNAVIINTNKDSRRRYKTLDGTQEIHELSKRIGEIQLTVGEIKTCVTSLANCVQEIERSISPKKTNLLFWGLVFGAFLATGILSLGAMSRGNTPQAAPIHQH